MNNMIKSSAILMIGSVSLGLMASEKTSNYSTELNDIYNDALNLSTEYKSIGGEVLSQDLIEPEKVRLYSMGLHDVYNEVLKLSTDYKALEGEKRSTEVLYDAEKKYYMPKVLLSTELNQYYGTPTPDPDFTDTLKVNVDIKLYGTGVDDRINAAKYTLAGSDEALSNIQLTLYYTVLRQLVKIERTRQYESDIKPLTSSIVDYMAKQKNSSEEGVSSLSNYKESELEFKKYNDSISRVVSSIDRYFRQLRDETNYQTDYNESVGLSADKIESLMNLDVLSYDISQILKSNSDIINRQYLLDAQFHTANSQRERLSVSLLNETQFEIFGSDEWNSADIKDSSYIGVKVNYDLFNYQASQGQKSAYHLYDVEKERFEKLKEQYLSQADSLKKEYEDLQSKKTSLLEQIKLNEELVLTQENELLINKLEYVDIVKSMVSLNESYVTLLNYDISILDAVIDTLTLYSVKFEFDE